MEFYEAAVANGAISKANHGLQLAREQMDAIRADRTVSPLGRELFERLFHGESANIAAELTEDTCSGAHCYETVLGVLDSIELLLADARLDRADRQTFYRCFRAPRTALLAAQARFEEIGL